jgi:hypothetical protein
MAIFFDTVKRFCRVRPGAPEPDGPVVRDAMALRRQCLDFVVAVSEPLVPITQIQCSRRSLFCPLSNRARFVPIQVAVSASNDLDKVA